MREHLAEGVLQLSGHALLEQRKQRLRCERTQRPDPCDQLVPALVGLAGSVAFYLLFGIATIYHSVALMFVSRIGAGIAGATISTAHAYIADVTTLENRTKGMALIGAASIILRLSLKARSEERFLMIELGGEAYQAYCRRVPMLIPFILRR